MLGLIRSAGLPRVQDALCAPACQSSVCSTAHVLCCAEERTAPTMPQLAIGPCKQNVPQLVLEQPQRCTCTGLAHILTQKCVVIGPCTQQE